MVNIELTKYYLSKTPAQTGNMPETAYFDIIKALDAHFNKEWTWELASETFAMEGTRVAATVILYTPGRIYTGRATCEVKEFANAHLFALLEACQTFMDKSGANPIQQPPQQTANMSSEQIMNAINGTDQKNNAAQVYNHKDEHGVHSDSVPYNNMSDKATQEIQDETFNGNYMNPPESQSETSQNNQQPNNDYNMPKSELHGYSQRQLDDIEKFKKTWDVVNNDMFNNYVKMWNKNLTKADLNPQNIDEFLAWTNKLGK